MYRLSNWIYDGNAVFIDREEEDAAQEIIQEGRLVALPPHICAAILLAENAAPGGSIGTLALFLESGNEHETTAPGIGATV
jgi:hypothetical protein